MFGEACFMIKKKLYKGAKYGFAAMDMSRKDSSMSGKRVTLQQRKSSKSVKKIMLEIWDMKGPTTIDIFEKSATP